MNHFKCGGADHHAAGFVHLDDRQEYVLLPSSFGERPWQPKIVYRPLSQTTNASVS